MDHKFIQSREAILNARDALRRGDMTQARQWAEQAARLAPQSEDPWLILAAVASPRQSVDYVRKALQANPNSQRGRKAMEWAMQRLGESPEVRKGPESAPQAQVRAETSAVLSLSKSSIVPERSESPQNPRKRSLLLPILLLVIGCAVFGVAAYSAARSPVLASILSPSRPSPISQPRTQPYALANIAKPTYTAMPETSTAQHSLASSILRPTELPTDIPTIMPTEPVFTMTEPPLPADTSTPEPEMTPTPGTLMAEIVPDTPTPEYAYVAPTDAPFVSPDVTASGEHWIDVNLTQQRVYAYAGDTIINSFIVSTGTWQHPTVTGKYRIWIKLLSDDMAGPGYYLPDVPYTMYFYKGYALHGTYWHNNFGTPMSHGCVNLSIPDAAWLYDFSVVGTVVNVHY